MSITNVKVQESVTIEYYDGAPYEISIRKNEDDVNYIDIKFDLQETACIPREIIPELIKVLAKFNQ